MKANASPSIDRRDGEERGELEPTVSNHLLTSRERIPLSSVTLDQALKVENEGLISEGRGKIELV